MVNRLLATPLIVRDLAIDLSWALGVSAILGFGVLALGAKSRSPALRFMANHLAMAMLALAPAVVATLAWPIFYLGSLRQGAGLALIVAALVFCIAWAWVQTRWIAGHLTELMGRKHERLWKTLALTGQILGVLASGPLFFGTLYVLKVLDLDVVLT